MENLEKAIIYASIIGTVLSEYEKSPKAIMDIKRQVKKFMYRRSRTNEKIYKKSVLIGHKIWSLAITHFAQQEIKIDSFSLIVGLWGAEDKNLIKFVNLTEKRITRFCLINDNDLLNPELDGYKVAAYINEVINKEDDDK